MAYRVFVFAIFLAILGISTVEAQVPGMIYYQGRLFNRVTGEPEDGLVPFRFRLLSAPQDPSIEYWSELHNNDLDPTTESVLVENGFYEVQLGRFEPIPAQIFSATDIYLEIQIATDPPMTPRQRILTVPFAFHADMLDGKHGHQYVDVANFIAHASDPHAHHKKTTDAAEILTGVFEEARIPATIARISSLQPFQSHLQDYNNPHRVTLEQAGAVTSHDILIGAKGFLSHSSIDNHILGKVASATTPLYDHACPEDMVQVGYSCVDKRLFRNTGQTTPLLANWFDAAKKCAAAGKRLCRNTEWYVACSESEKHGVTEIGVEREWVDQWANDVTGTVNKPVFWGLGGCESSRTATQPTVLYNFRCCR